MQCYDVIEGYLRVKIVETKKFGNSLPNNIGGYSVLLKLTIFEISEHESSKIYGILKHFAFGHDWSITLAPMIPVFNC